MASRPQGVQSAIYNGAGPVDVVVKANPGLLYSFNIQWNNATVGDQIHIHDAATADTTATKRFTFQFPTTAGSFAATLPSVGIQYFVGLFLNYQIAGPNLNISIGFD